MVEYGFVESLLESVVSEIDEIATIHLNTLKLLMYGEGKCVALKNDGFNIFVSFLERNAPDIVSGALDCLMILTSTPRGKQLAMQNHLLKTLNRLLNYGVFLVFVSRKMVIIFFSGPQNKH